MNEAYRDALNTDGPEYYVLQLCFLLYLLLGQLVVLFAWRLAWGLVRGKAGGDSWKSRLAFVVYVLAAQVGLLLAWPRLAGLWLETDAILKADVMVTIHLTLVLAALLVLVLVPIGALCGWRWTRNFWVRLVHLTFIEIVAGQALVRLECPLLTVERDLRGGKGKLVVQADDPASPVGRVCNNVLYAPNEGPRWAVRLAYAIVGLIVLLTWLVVPPRMPWHSAATKEEVGAKPPPRLGVPPQAIHADPFGVKNDAARDLSSP